MKILIATKNQGKVRELAELLADSSFELQSLDNYPNIVEPEETGATFEENAVLKAKSYAQQTGLLALADDSGLEVAALDNAPGVYSARYAGANATDAERIEKLLSELKTIEKVNSPAQFVCVMALADAAGEVKFIAEGVCEGVISDAPRGANGFGYDPIFVPEGFHETFGELSGEAKAQISHRARATKKIIAYLRDFTAV